MQVKVFEAQDMRSALEKVKQALGPDALILSSRTREKQGRGKSGVIEVTAAVDNGMAEADAPRAYRQPGSFQSYLENSGQSSFVPSTTGSESETRGGLREELKEMRRSVQYFSRELSRMKTGGNAGVDFHGTGSVFSGLGISPEVQGLITEYFTGTRAGSAGGDAPDAGRMMKDFISGSIRIKDFMDGTWQGQKRAVFIGPTGVGKTTTIAKVAANFMFSTGKSAALVTIDNYRIAAAEQLKIYGEIMNIPVETARTPGGLADIFRRLRDRDLVLVDTAGRSPKDEMRIQELAGFLAPELGVENHLVLSAATGEQGLYTAIDRFSHLGIHGLVMTKLDECDVLGQILGAGLRAECPLSFLTNGQKVPEDLITPDPGGISRMILNPEEVVAGWNITKAGTRQEACAS